MKRTLTMIGFVALSAAGCANAPGEPTAPTPAVSASAADANAAEANVVHRTVVHLHADGTEDTKEETLPAAQAEREHAAWQARRGGGAVANATADGSCQASSMWLFDHTVAGSSGTYPNNHEICFYADGNGCADLRNYSRYCTTVFHPGGGITYQCYPWSQSPGYASAVQSFWAGSDRGYFTGSDGFYSGTASFAAYQRVDDTSAGATAGDPWYFTRYAQFLCFQ